jgi:hypothetical protein
MKQLVIDLKRAGFPKKVTKQLVIYSHPMVRHIYLDKLLDEVYG